MARRILARDPHCTLAYPGCTGTSEEADHIVPHFLATRLGWPLEDIDDEDNGQGVCRNCHALKTSREARYARQQTAPQRPSRQRPKRPHPGVR